MSSNMIYTHAACGKKCIAKWDSNPNTGDYKRVRCPICGVSEKSEYLMVNGAMERYHFEKFTQGAPQ